MYNFFWEFTSLFKNDDWIFFLPFCLIVASPCWLGFLFSALHAKVRFKPLWLTLWIVIAVGVLVGIGVLAFFLLKQDEDRLGWVAGMVWAMVLSIGLFLFSSWLGRRFNPRKIVQWLYVPLIFVGGVSCFWLFTRSLMLQPFGEIKEVELTEDALKEGSDWDYEIGNGGTEGAFDFENDSRWMRIRVKGDSAYYQVIYQMCNNMEKADSSQWTLLDLEKTAMVKKLKKRIAAYEQEFSTAEILDGYGFSIVLKDFKEKRRKTLSFLNTDGSYVHDAITIEKMAIKLWPLRETYTKLSADEAMKKCMESQKK